VGIEILFRRGQGQAGFEDPSQGLLDRAGEIVVPAGRIALVGKIGAHCDFHLHRVDAIRRSSVGAGDPAAFEATVDYVRPSARGADGSNPLGQRKSHPSRSLVPMLKTGSLPGNRRGITT